ncbi:MAG: formylaminopyrimidine deformylase [Thermomicrobiales bacterium]|jgi:acetylornithine deacetylase|nr:formylaminopyrimidine deformylase [Thermomicrobiales bacterium]
MDSAGTRAAVLAQIDAMRDEITATLQTLVRIPSITPKYPGLDYDEVVGGEKRCNEALIPTLKAAGAEIDLWEEEPGRGNLVGVVKGSGGGRSLIYNGHIDTVPPGDPATWTGGDPYAAEVRDGKIYGIGACDMKAGIAAQSMAAVALKRCGVQLQGDLILESVCGEETMDHNVGVSATVKRGYTADAAIVTEPCALPYPAKVAPCSVGSAWLRITVQGKATHILVRGELIWPGGAGEAYGVNAIDKGIFIANAVRKLEENWGLTKSHPLYRPGHFNIGMNLMVGRPPGPPVPFIVPHEAILDYIVIYLPNETSDAVFAEVETFLNGVYDQDPWLKRNRPTMEWRHNWPPYDTPLDHPICQTIAQAHQEALGVPAEFQGFAAVDDATYLERGGIPSISYGPGNLMVCHAVDEHVAIDDVVKACKVLAVTAMDWCGVG